MARAGKPSGNKRTAFGKRTGAEKAFRERKRPSAREGGERPKKDFSPRKSSGRSAGEGSFERPRRPGFSKSGFTKRSAGGSAKGYSSRNSTRGDGENRFGKDEKFGPSKFKRSEGAAKGYSSGGPKKEGGENRFGDKEQKFGPSKFKRNASGPARKFDKPKFDKPFERRSDDGERGGGFSKEKKFRPSGPRRSDSEEPRKRFSKSVDGKKDGDRFAKFKKENRFDRETKKAVPSSGGETPKGDGLVRLNKFMANSGVGSRRQADEYIKMGLVTVNGETITEMGHKVKPTDDIRYEGRKLKAEPLVYILLNKPKGFITTTDDPEERKTVMELVANACKERIYPVGRLDRNTTGLLLLTNDGDLADKLTHPSYNAKKIYKVDLDRPLSKNDFQKILDGVYFEEGRAQVDDLALVSDDGKEVGVEIHIGWNRIVRRIFEALGYQIERLDRVAYAGLDKKDLGRGQWRFLKPEEVVRLKHFNG